MQNLFANEPLSTELTNDDLTEIDTSNIIPGSSRTRGLTAFRQGAMMNDVEFRTDDLLHNVRLSSLCRNAPASLLTGDVQDHDIQDDPGKSPTPQCSTNH
jgi:hypothetical protein